MNRRSFLKNVAIGGAAATAISIPAVAQEKMWWRLAAMYPQRAKAFAIMVADASDWRLNIEVLDAEAGSINPADIAAQVGQGTVEMGHGLTALWAKNVPAATWFSIVPFGLTAHERSNWFMYGDGQTLADEAFGEIGCKYMPMGDTGCQMGGWFKNEIRDPSDLKGLRMRVGGSGAEVMRAAGVKTVSLPFGKIAGALEKGEIDAGEAVGPAVDLSLGLHKQAKYYYYPGWHEPAGGFGLVINKAKWESLYWSQQSNVLAAAENIHNRILSDYCVSNCKALKTLVDEHGVQLRRFPDDVLKVLASHAEVVLPGLAAKDEGAKKVYDNLVTFRRNASSWSSISETAYITARTMVMS